MARGRRLETTVFEIPVLPPFPTQSFDIVVSFEDGTTEIIGVMAKGKVSAITTSSYVMDKWPPDKIATITGLTVALRKA